MTLCQCVCVLLFENFIPSMSRRVKKSHSHTHTLQSLRVANFLWNNIFVCELLIMLCCTILSCAVMCVCIRDACELIIRFFIRFYYFLNRSHSSWLIQQKLWAEWAWAQLLHYCTHSKFNLFTRIPNGDSIEIHNDEESTYVRGKGDERDRQIDIQKMKFVVCVRTSMHVFVNWLITLFQINSLTVARHLYRLLALHILAVFWEKQSQRFMFQCDYSKRISWKLKQIKMKWIEWKIKNKWKQCVNRSVDSFVVFIHF